MCVTSLRRPYEKVRKRRCQYSWQFKKNVSQRGLGSHRPQGTTAGLNTKRLRRTLHTVDFDIHNSLTAVSVDLFGLCRKLARTCSTSSSAVNGRPLDFCLHRHSVSVNCLYHARMVFSLRTLHEMHVAQ
jgi:hypothetical protein